MASPRDKAARAALMSSADDIEAQFYEALQQADLSKLMALWSQDEDIVCVHPGSTRAVGPAEIRASLEAIFAAGPVLLQPTSVRRLDNAELALHSVLERIDVPTDDGPRTAWVVATNVYRRTTFGWRMIAHHASPAGLDDGAVHEDASATLH